MTPTTRFPDPGRTENEGVNMRPWWVLLGIYVGLATTAVALALIWGAA